MEFFDCNCTWGVPMKPGLKPALTTAAITEEMERVGLQRALVRNCAVFEESPEFGNPLTVAGAAEDPRLVPSWGILPPQTGELGDVPTFLAAMKAAGVAALWAYPTQHRYLLNTTTMGGLCEELQDRGVVLFLPRSETSGGLDAYATADFLLQDFPRLHLCIVGHGSWGEDRYFRPLLERFPNFMVDTSRYELDGGIEEICHKYGAHRLLFGTAFPGTPMAAAYLTLLHANISDEDRALVASGNLTRLLAEAKL